MLYSNTKTENKTAVCTDDDDNDDEACNPTHVPMGLLGLLDPDRLHRSHSCELLRSNTEFP